MVPLKPFFGKSARMEVDAPITLFNRHTGRMETEQVYGEAWLRRIYGNPLGKLTLHAVVKRGLFPSYTDGPWIARAARGASNPS